MHRILNGDYVKIVFALCCMAGLCGQAQSQHASGYSSGANPFTSSSNKDAHNNDSVQAGDHVAARSESPVNTSGDESMVNPGDANVPFWYPLVVWQKRINDKLSHSLSSLRYHASIWQVFLIFAISLGYSLLHTAGPGHGKLILSTYFLTSDAKRKRSDAALAGSIVSLTHIGTAFVLSLILYLLLNTLSMSSQRDMATISKQVGGILVVITGVAICATTLFNKRLSRIQQQVAEGKFKNLSLVGVAILSGIVPCPLAWFVLIFSISYSIYVYGIISIVGMAIGAAITVGTTGYLVLYAKEKAFGFLKSGITEKAAVYLRGFGGLVLVMLGAVMIRSV